MTTLSFLDVMQKIGVLDLTIFVTLESKLLANTKFHRFLVPSPAGGLPIGYMITSGESEELLTEKVFQNVVVNF